MTTDEIILQIKKRISDDHAFSAGLGESTSIHLDRLLNLTGITPTEIHVALLTLKEKEEIELDSMIQT